MALRKLVSINPFTNKVLKEYNFMGLEEIAKRIQKSKEAFDQYKVSDFADRAEKLNRLADIMEKDKEKYGQIMTKEMGKPLSASIGEVVKSANHCRFYAKNLAKYLEPEILNADARKCYIKYQPLGPLLYIVPFNFPWWLSFKSGAAQLAAGNTLLMRHSHGTPETGLAIESLFEKAGYNSNICQSVLSPHSYTEEIISNPLIQGVTFTGSTAAGRQIASLSGKYLKKCVMELGGNDPFIILNDADINLAVECAIKSRASNSGQTCFSAKRYVIVEEKYEEFKAALKARLEKLVLGDPMDPKTDMGPLARKDLLKTLESLIEQTKKIGYNIIVCGKKLPNNAGNFYPPTIIEADRNCPTTKKEAFGPIFTLLKVKNEQEAIVVANDTQYGLGATVISNNIKKAEEIAWKIDAGMVFVNEFVKSDSRFPSGGIKESGFGRECADHGLKEFMNAKTIYIK